MTNYIIVVIYYVQQYTICPPRTQSVNAKYQLYNVITNEWCDSVLDSADYGRTDESSSRWIQFKSTEVL